MKNTNFLTAEFFNHYPEFSIFFYELEIGILKNCA